VEPHPALQGQLVVQRLADHRVGEPVAARRARQLLHEPALSRLVEVAEQSRAVGGHELHQRLERELGPDHRRGPQRAHHVGRERVEPPPDRLAHAIRHGQPARRKRAFGQRALGHQQAHHLVDEQRVALGERVEALDQARRGVRRMRRRQLLHLVARQAREQQAPPGAREVSQRAGDLGVHARLGAAVGADREHARAAQPAAKNSSRRIVAMSAACRSSTTIRIGSRSAAERMKEEQASNAVKRVASESSDGADSSPPGNSSPTSGAI